jgi:hypothetical protein
MELSETLPSSSVPPSNRKFSIGETRADTQTLPWPWAWELTRSLSPVWGLLLLLHADLLLDFLLFHKESLICYAQFSYFRLDPPNIQRLSYTIIWMLLQHGYNWGMGFYSWIQVACGVSHTTTISHPLLSYFTPVVTLA